MSAPPPASPADLVGGRWPVVGRGPQLTLVRAALAGRGAVLVGPAGAGKTTLADQAVPRPAGRLVGAPGTRDRTLWAIRLLAPDAATIEDAAEDAPAALRKAHRGAGAPVLRVDDLDDLDDASVAVVARLALAGAARVVATRRTGPAPDAVASLWREAGLTRVEVPPLDEDDTATLVREALGGLLDGRAGATLWTISRGNPQVVHDVVVASVASGSLRCQDGFWRLVGEPAVGGPTTERVTAMLAGLGTAARDGVEALALTGPVPLALAERLVATEVLERLERAGQVTIDDARVPPDVRLADPAVEVVVTTLLPVLARRRLAERASTAADETLGSSPADPDLALRAAVWRVDAGRPCDASALIAAARLAVDQRDTVLGERLAGLAAAKGGGAEAVLLQSWCADEHGNTEASATALDAYQPADDAERVALAIRRAEQHYWILRQRDVAATVLADAATAVAEPWPLAIAAQGAVFAALDGHPDEALTATSGLLDHPQPQVGSTSALAATIALAVADRPAEAEQVAETALARLGGADATFFIDPGVHIIGLLFALQGQGRLVDADQLVTDVYRHTLTRPGHQAQGWAAMLRAYVLLARGRPADAAEAAQEAELVWDSAKLQGTGRWSATIGALALGELGDEDAMDQALARAVGRDATGFELFEPELLRARAWRALRAGADPEPLLVAATEQAIERGTVALAATAAHDLVRVGRPSSACALLARLPKGSAVTEARRRLAEASAAGDAAGLVAVAATFDGFGAAGWAAEARALAAAADPARATSLRPAIAAWVEQTGAATPPLAAVVAGPAERSGADTLTSREREVARLAADGLANREIAAQLVVSLRTVENHLHRSFTKLGVTTRGELADHLADGPR